MTKDIAEVKKLYEIFLSNRTLCELKTPVCTKLATVVHHKKGRGSNLKKVETWMASCPACNGWVEQHTAEAYRLGLKEKRHTIERMIELLHIDCMEYMKTVPDKYFDLAVVDPPYGIGISSNPFRQKQQTKSWDNSIPEQQYFIELSRITKDQIVWGGNYFALPASQGFLIWDKKQPENFSSSMVEMAWMSIQSPDKMISIHVVTAEKNKIHPTQKPVKLYDWIYQNYLYCKTCDNRGSYYEDVVGDGGPRMLMTCEDCALGEGRNYRVLDTHLGSGSNAIAAHKTGNIDFVGCEIDKDYYDAAVKRFNNHKAQQVLF